MLPDLDAENIRSCIDAFALRGRITMDGELDVDYRAVADKDRSIPRSLAIRTDDPDRRVLLTGIRACSLHRSPSERDIWQVVVLFVLGSDFAIKAQSLEFLDGIRSQSYVYAPLFPVPLVVLNRLGELGEISQSLNLPDSHVVVHLSFFLVEALLSGGLGTHKYYPIFSEVCQQLFNLA